MCCSCKNLTKPGNRDLPPAWFWWKAKTAMASPLTKKASTSARPTRQPLSGPDQVISAILGAREGAAETGYQLRSTGVIWTDPGEAAALRDALAARKVENVMLVSAFLAAAALAQVVGGSVGYGPDCCSSSPLLFLNLLLRLLLLRRLRLRRPLLPAGGSRPGSGANSAATDLQSTRAGTAAATMGVAAAEPRWRHPGGGFGGGHGIPGLGF